jgi:hypothetical protein
MLMLGFTLSELMLISTPLVGDMVGATHNHTTS